MKYMLFVEAVSMIPPLVLDIQPHHKVIFTMNKLFYSKFRFWICVLRLVLKPLK
jgi:hypothetical protein